MPNSDPLAKQLAAWSRGDLDDLVGRVESERLEIKGADTDINSAEGRRSIARELAGMISSSGGFIVVGTVPGEDRVSAYPGVAVTSADLDALRRSLQDQVRPSPALFRGPVLFDADNEELSVIVLEVLPHPLGLPGSTGGRFYARSGDETRPLDYREVQRRFAAVNEATEPVRTAAIEAARKASHPINTDSSMRQTTDDGRHREYQPFSIGIAPTDAPWDLGMTGQELLDACTVAAESERAAFSEIDASAEDLLYSRATTVVGGVIANSPPYSVIQFGHAGIFGAAHLTMLSPFAEGASVDPKYVGTLLARFSAVGLRLIAATAGPTAVYVSATSGTIPAVARGFPLPQLGSLMPNSQATVEFVSDVRGSGAVAAVAEASRVLTARICDAAVGGSSWGNEREELAGYLSAVLA